MFFALCRSYMISLHCKQNSNKAKNSTKTFLFYVYHFVTLMFYCYRFFNFWIKVVRVGTPAGQCTQLSVPNIPFPVPEQNSRLQTFRLGLRLPVLDILLLMFKNPAIP